jgi:hypothetical protein
MSTSRWSLPPTCASVRMWLCMHALHCYHSAWMRICLHALRSCRSLQGEAFFFFSEFTRVCHCYC